MANRLYFSVTEESRKQVEDGDSYLHKVEQCEEAKAELLGSLCNNGLHMPVLDIDFPCQLIPSKREGHFHLLIDKEITWEKYRDILYALESAKICEGRWVECAMLNNTSLVRKPGTMKIGRKDG